MRRGKGTEVMAELLAIRDVQRRAAEARLRDAQDGERRRTDERDDARDALHADEAAWTSVMGARVDPAVAACWAAIVVASDARLRGAEAEAAAAAEQRRDRTSDWQRAIAVEDVARGLAGRARRKARRAGDERAATALAERPRIARRGE